MLSQLAWLILLALVVAAAPAVGLLLGLGCSAAFMSVSERWCPPGHEGRVGTPAAFEMGLPEADEVHPAARAEREWKWPEDRVNLPGRLLRERQRLFRVECVDARTGLTRAYAVAAKHAGAAEMKAHLWGERTRGIRPLVTDH